MKKCLLTLFFVLCLSGNASFSLAAPAQTTEETPAQTETAIPTQTNNDDDDVSQKDLYDTIVKTKDEKISLLQGNISNVISFFSVAIAILAVLITGIFGLFGYVLNTKFTKKYEEVKKTEANIDRKWQKIEDVQQELKILKEEKEQTNSALKERDEQLTDFIEWQKSMNHHLFFHDIQATRNLKFAQFLYLKTKSITMFEEMERILKMDIYKYNDVLENDPDLFRQLNNMTVFEDVEPMRIEKPLRFAAHFALTVKELDRIEKEIWKHANENLTYERLFESRDDEAEPISYRSLQTEIGLWIAFYEPLEKMHSKLKVIEKVLLKLAEGNHDK